MTFDLSSAIKPSEELFSKPVGQNAIHVFEWQRLKTELDY